MEVFSLLLESTYGVAALSSVTLAVGMLFGTLSLLTYKVNQVTATLN